MEIGPISAFYNDYMPLIAVLALWSVIWKGLALYRAGRVKDPVWFVVLLLVNTVGILEILYLFVFSKRASRQKYLDA